MCEPQPGKEQRTNVFILAEPLCIRLTWGQRAGAVLCVLCSLSEARLGGHVGHGHLRLGYCQRMSTTDLWTDWRTVVDFDVFLL